MLWPWRWWLADRRWGAVTLPLWGERAVGVTGAGPSVRGSRASMGRSRPRGSHAARWPVTGPLACGGIVGERSRRPRTGLLRPGLGATPVGLPQPERVLARPRGSMPGGSVHCRRSCRSAAGCQLGDVFELACKTSQFAIDIAWRVHGGRGLEALGQPSGVLFV